MINGAMAYYRRCISGQDLVKKEIKNAVKGLGHLTKHNNFFFKELNIIFQEISLDIVAVPLQAKIKDLYVE